MGSFGPNRKPMSGIECFRFCPECMDRLPFASEGVLSEVADMYPASHEGVLYKLIFHRGFSSCISGSSSAVQGEALVMGRVLPANLTSGGKIFPPRSRIRAGRAPGGRHHSVRRHFSHQAGQRRHPLGHRCPCCVAVWAKPVRRLSTRGLRPRPQAPRPGLRTATRRSEAGVPLPPPLLCACAVPCR